MNWKLYYTRLFFRCLVTGQFRRLWREIHIRIYRQLMSLKFQFIILRRQQKYFFPLLQTDFPIAEKSLDNLHPKGAKTGLTNRGFLLAIEKLIPHRPINYLDLGCAQGQLVKDSIKLGWRAVGIDGARASLKGHQEYIWNFFSADITEPFFITNSTGLDDLTFDLITAWEVLEHIPAEKLPQLFKNIIHHLNKGGMFIASTNREPDIHEGVDLHVTKWTNKQWINWITTNCPELMEILLPLKTHEYARQNFKDPSFLIFIKP